MKNKNILLRLPLIILISMILGCGTTKEFDFWGYYNHLQETFKVGTEEFFQGRYFDAKNLFYNYNQIDSNYFNYESYAFLAECYNKLGMQDSGKIVYENIIQKINNEINKKPKTSENQKLDVKDLEKWYSNYPNFPDNLKKENGFVPFDNLPGPIGGISAIEKYLVYPITSSGDKLEGKVYVLTLIDKNGKAIDFRIVKSLAKPYDIAAENAISRASFTIPKRKGKPHKVWVAIPVEFKLQ